MRVLRAHRLEFNKWIAGNDPGAKITLQAVDIGISISPEDRHSDGRAMTTATINHHRSIS
jgi:hypothetical protein